MPLASHSILASSAALNFMPFLGLSVAACVRVGAALGDGSPAAAQRTLAAARLLGGGLAALNGCLLLAAGSVWGGIFTGDAAVVAATAAVMPLLASYAVMDGAQCVLSGVLRGCALAGLAAAINIAAYLAGVALAVGLSDPAGAGWGLAGVWAAFNAAVLLCTALMAAALARRDWPEMARIASARGSAEAGEGGPGQGAHVAAPARGEGVPVGQAAQAQT